MSIKLLVETANDLRDSLTTSGVFEMTDCVVSIDCPMFTSEVEEVQRMVSIIESAINVVDVDVVVNREDSSYMVEIIEVPIDLAEGRAKKFRE